MGDGALGFWGALLVSEAGTTLDEMRRFMEIAIDEAGGDVTGIGDARPAAAYVPVVGRIAAGGPVLASSRRAPPSAPLPARLRQHLHELGQVAFGVRREGDAQLQLGQVEESTQRLAVQGAPPGL